MVAGKRRHIVPQLMIRRFAGPDGKLIELHKPTLRLGTRRRSPSGILFQDDAYKDRVGDLDADLFQRVEQEFATHYAQIADHPWQKRVWPGEVGAAFVNWVAAMIARTSPITTMAAVLAEANPLMRLAYAATPDVMDNIMREGWFGEWQNLLARPQWCWKCRIIPEARTLILTDNPVCQTNGLGPGGIVVLVPLSKHRILFGGTREAVERCGDMPVAHMNAFLAAWAERSIFASDAATLHEVVRHLKGEVPGSDPAWCEAARKPLFALREGAASRRPPPGLDLHEFWEGVKSRYGPPIYERPGHSREGSLPASQKS